MSKGGGGELMMGDWRGELMRVKNEKEREQGGEGLKGIGVGTDGT